MFPTIMSAIAIVALYVAGCLAGRPARRARHAQAAEVTEEVAA
jgi:hypothetical protein